MSIISQETWDNIPKEEKERIRTFVFELTLGRALNDKSGTPSHKHQFAIDKIEELFGKENLQPKPKIRTWEDVEKKYQYHNDQCESLCKHLYDDIIDDKKLRNKLIATYKIAKLIELGYGGMVSEEEWKLSSSYITETRIWSIVCQYKAESKDIELKIISVWTQPCLLSFHTKEQAEEFMSYSENVELVKQYYMI